MILNNIDGMLIKVSEVNRELNQLKTQVQDVALNWERDLQSAASAAKEALIPQPQKEQPVAPKPPVTPPPLPKGAMTSPATPTPKPAVKKVAAAQPIAQAKAKPQQAKPVASTPPKKTFWERNPNLEKLVGEKLFPLIGIFVFVTGIGFLVSWAIENEYINTTGRAGIGLLCGGILLGVAHRLRKKYRAFSSVLLGGGIATLYFTITYAHQIYHLFGPHEGSGQLVAFAALAGLTLFTVLASIFYDRKEVAILGLIGGFATPFLVSTGSGNYVALFSYMIVLNLGMAVLAYFRNWKVINILCFGFTLIIFSSWATLWTFENKLPKAGALTFATAFFAIFFVQNIVYNATKGIKFKAWEYILLLMNSFAYFGGGLYIVAQFKSGVYNGTFTAAVALVHFAFAFALYKKNKLDTNLIYTLIGMVLTFVTLIAPIQLDGNHITMFWAAEAVLLFWMSQKAKLPLLRTAALGVLTCMVGSLLMDWSAALIHAMTMGAEGNVVNIIFNKTFITSLLGIGALIGTNILLKREDKEARFALLGTDLGKVHGFRSVLPFITALFIYISGLLELKFQVMTRTGDSMLSMMLIGMYHLILAIGLQAYSSRTGNKLIKGATAIFSTLVIVGYLGMSIPAIQDLRYNLLYSNGIASMTAFNFHYLNTALTLGLLYLLGRQIKTASWSNALRSVFLWGSTFFLVVIFCVELDNLLVMQMFNGQIASEDLALRYAHKAGYPIVWGAIAFWSILFGLRRKNFQLRLVGLSLLGLTIFKIFLFDVWEMPQLGRILAFVSLGLLILIISFMYQRLRKLLFDNEKAATTEQTPTENV